MTDYLSRITEDLIKLGIREGDSLLVHSSLNAIGRFDNRAQTLIDAFFNVLGKTGTLLLPALSYENVTEENPVFDVEKTPSCVGGLTEYFRSLPGVYRSIHPTHSVCARGNKTAYFLERHHLDNTPCGPNSPFRKLGETGGKILFLGCGLRPNTSMHGIEELVKPEYLLNGELEYTIIPKKGEHYRKTYITHNFRGWEQRYDRVPEVLGNDDYSRGNVLGADSWVIDTQPLWKKAYAKLSENPLFFVDKTT